MRAVKTVISAAGNLKRASPEENEEALLLRALQVLQYPLGHIKTKLTTMHLLCLELYGRVCMAPVSFYTRP